MTQNDVEKDFEALSVSFDPSKFIDQIMITISNLRSDSGPMPGTLFDGANSIAPGKFGESRLNAFLRILGFPATRNQDSLSSQNDKLQNFRQQLASSPNVDQSIIDLIVEAERERLLSQDHTLNYFDPSWFEKLADDKIDVELTKRESALSKPENTEKSVNMVRDPLSIRASISKTEAKSRRPQLFPLVVNADIPVFPLNKRIAPIFYNGDFVLNKSRLSRPFLEHVIYIRVKVFSGQQTALHESLKKNIQAEVSSLDEASSIINNLDNFNLISLQLTDKFIKVLKKSSQNYVKVKNQIKNIENKSDIILAPKQDPSEKSGEIKLSKKEIQDILRGETSSDDSSSEDEEVITSKALDEKIERLFQEVNKLETFLSILPTQQIAKQDSARRIDEDIVINNISSDLFISEFTSLMFFELDALRNKLNEAKAERAKLIGHYENLKYSISQFTGESTGLSIFDIICTLFAIFTIDIKYLIGLLNDDAKNRLLSNDSFYAISERDDTLETEKTINIIADGASSVTVGAAVLAIQEEIEKHFALAEAFMQQFSKGGENRIS